MFWCVLLQITQCAATIATAVDNIDVKDVGKVVLTFEEL